SIFVRNIDSSRIKVFVLESLAFLTKCLVVTVLGCIARPFDFDEEFVFTLIFRNLECMALESEEAILPCDC
ncbi:hypothetical protein PMAYCL1PPCAC_25281, partial [Pristionchus mayeri]